MKCTSILVLAFIAFSVNTPAESARILAVFPCAGPSQYILVQPYLKALAARGHEVSVISAFPQKEKVKNFRDIPVTDILKDYDVEVSKLMGITSKWEEYNFFATFLKKLTVIIMENQQVKQLLQSNEKFDLIIVETVQVDALYGLGQHFNAPLIGVSSFGTDLHNDELVGNTSPPSYLPIFSEEYTLDMNFWQRLTNFYYITLQYIHSRLVHLPMQQQLYKHYFPNAKLNMLEVRKSFSLILLNQHFSIGLARPYVPNMIQVGGFHINYEPKPLPADMTAFINGSEHGVIYFSMGSNIKSKDLPKETLDMFLETFASLKQDVMWKFETTDLPGKPSNLFISNWFPQSDILAHPKVLLFFSHGGLLSTIESIYHGKPILGIPMFYDQFLNVETAKASGYALSVDFHTLTKESLTSAINEILENKKYASRAAQISRRFKDQPMSPMDTAIYWTEYVLRHDGAKFMRVSAQDLSLMEYHNLDVIFVLFGLPLIASVTILIMLQKIYCWMFKNKALTQSKKQKSH